jgi:hypothetical protein
MIYNKHRLVLQQALGQGKKCKKVPSEADRGSKTPGNLQEFGATW